MDIPRPDFARKRRVRRFAYATVGILVLGAVSLGLSHLEPALPSLTRESVVFDTVKRGTIPRQVRGPGTLVPEHLRWVTAVTAGRVERVLAQPGRTLEEDFVLVELSNQDLQLQALEAQKELVAAEAEFLNLRGNLETQLLAQESVVATVRNDLQDARRRLVADEKLMEVKSISELDLSQSRDRAGDLEARLKIEEKRYRVQKEAREAQLQGKQAQVERLRGIAGFRAGQLQSLTVRAATCGVLKEIPLEVGQWVTPGMLLAKVVDPRRLKAALRIVETQTRDVLIGQKAMIDTRNGEVPGHVSRIDPASSQDGTVTVDVALDGPLPRGARPDLSVEGVIELELLEDVLYVQRPTYGQEGTRIGIFRLEPGGEVAVNVAVTLGRTSVRFVEITEGLREGDRVIVSDTSSQTQDSPRVRLR
jgi:multidrug resistance efflux pump